MMDPMARSTVVGTITGFVVSYRSDIVLCCDYDKKIVSMGTMIEVKWFWGVTVVVVLVMTMIWIGMGKRTTIVPIWLVMMTTDDEKYDVDTTWVLVVSNPHG